MGLGPLIWGLRRSVCEDLSFSGLEALALRVLLLQRFRASQLARYGLKLFDSSGSMSIVSCVGYGWGFGPTVWGLGFGVEALGFRAWLSVYEGQGLAA